ncbi:MAG: hypothetical protein HXY25_11290 [Alphaproteobacteria bacterium]|nr:hypothetical protein [Alphaproteobacteria bacterium]
MPYEDVDAVSTLCRPALAGARLVYRIHLPGGARVDLGRHAAGPDPSALDNLAEVDARLRRAGVPVLDAGGAGRAGWKLTEELACWQALGGLADEAVRARVLELFRPATPDQAF